MNTFLAKAALTGGKVMMVIGKNLPKILVVGGCAGFLVTCGLTAKAAVQVEGKLDNHNEKMDEITKKYDEKRKDSGSEQIFDEETAELKAEKRRFAGEMVRLWAPPVLTGATSIGMVLWGFGILDGRYVATSAALQATEKSFRSYRKNVINDQGEEADRRYYYDVQDNAVISTSEDGTQKAEIAKTIEDQPKHPFARFFDESSTQWVNSPEMNLSFLLTQQNYANDKLHRDGHLFLNEVYDMLGLPHSQIGAVCGWVDDPKNGGDCFVDFGIWDSKNEFKRAFVNGYEPVILLDFNCDAGTIWDKI